MSMVFSSAQEIWNLTNKELLDLINRHKIVKEPRLVHFYNPTFNSYQKKSCLFANYSFPTISITGACCALNCKHCGGKLLQTMHLAPTPEHLFNLCKKLKQTGAIGCLISGGCLPNGSVPIDQFIPTLARIKQDLGLTIFVHTGVIDYSTAHNLKKAEIDAALIDVIGNNQTILQTYNLKISTQDYQKSLEALQDAKLHFVPHVIVGLDNGKIKGEFDALHIISKYNPSAIVIIAFIPIPGTIMAKTTPPAAIDVARIVAVARVLFENTPLALGCMRPKGKLRDKIDLLSLKAGIDAITHPTDSVVQYAKENNYQIELSAMCCAHILKDFSKSRL